MQGIKAELEHSSCSLSNRGNRFVWPADHYSPVLHSFKWDQKNGCGGGKKSALVMTVMTVFPGKLIFALGLEGMSRNFLDRKRKKNIPDKGVQHMQMRKRPESCAIPGE